ncbi:hypothetical protein GCM10023214_08450 [Amycolatopsis dongchuanensis]|uniref:Integrase catalytic domain-containing protein n=1 Tax=Amycolatopsis dongchuanensis TaxID=1070866 RepID=A0ABP9PZI1_9PSEU
MKKIGKIPPGGGWRAHGRGTRPRAERGGGYDYVHAAIDDHSRLAYAEILDDEQGRTRAAFLLRAAAWFADHGIPHVQRILTDNAKNYVISRDFAAAVPNAPNRVRIPRRPNVTPSTPRARARGRARSRASGGAR